MAFSGTFIKNVNLCLLIIVLFISGSLNAQQSDHPDKLLSDSAVAWSQIASIDTIYTRPENADSIVLFYKLNDSLWVESILHLISSVTIQDLFDGKYVASSEVNSLFTSESHRQDSPERRGKLLPLSQRVSADSLILMVMLADSSWVDSTLNYIEITDVSKLIDLNPADLNDQLTDLGYDSDQEDFLSYAVEYNAMDSMLFDLTTNEVHLFGEAFVKYGDITLTADNIVYDFDSYLVYAEGGVDSVGNAVNKPIFKQGSESFDATRITYNFNTQKGFIKEVFSETNGAYVFAKKSKKQPNNQVHIKGGFFTTCDNPNPHYSFRTGKMIVIPDDKVVTGPGYLAVGKVPLPIALPFLMFPNKTNQSSGLVIPSYGDSREQGFFLRDGGFYWAMNDNIHTEFLGTIFTNGSWGIKNNTIYKKKYKYGGNFSVNYNDFKFGNQDINTGSYTQSKSYTLIWNHRQDPKASKYSSFSASVNYVNGSQYRDDISASVTNYVNQNFTSRISYNYAIPNSPFNLAATSSMTQRLNAQDGADRQTFNDLTLPQVTLNMNRIDLPLSWIRKNKAGKKRWYEKIGLTYNANLLNSLKFSPEQLDTINLNSENFRTYVNWRNGFKQNASLSTSLNAKTLSISPFVNVSNNIYSERINTFFNLDSLESITDTIRDISGVWGVNTGVNLTSKLYGMYAFKGDGWLKAMRHQITLTAGVTYDPGTPTNIYGYYGEDGTFINYSPYTGALFSPPNSRPRNVYNFRLINDLEAKVKTKGDSTTTFEKVKFIDNLSAGASFDAFKDSIRWSNISINGRFTNLLNVLNINYSLNLDPYAYNTSSQKIADSWYNQTGKLVRIERANIVAQLRIKSASKAKKHKPKNAAEQQIEEIESEQVRDAEIENSETGFFDNFRIPWNLNVNYNLTLNRPVDFDENGQLIESSEYIQTLGFSTNFTLFEIFRFSVFSGYDFLNKEIQPTTRLALYVDLHCWELTMSFIPLGRQQSYSINFNVKSPLLKDLKLKRQDYLGSGRGFF